MDTKRDLPLIWRRGDTIPYKKGAKVHLWYTIDRPKGKGKIFIGVSIHNSPVYANTSN